MGFLQDLKPVFRKHALKFLEKRSEAGNVVSFIFQYSEPLMWRAGQHGIFFFPHKMDGGSWRGFSVASHPGEGVVRIATRIQDKPSAFKQALLDLKPGDQISMRGPFGPFHLDNSRRPVVFIAGGIGITPYRSMILATANETDFAPTSIRLFYADDTRQYAFRQELDEHAASIPGFRAFYGTGKELPESITQSVRDAGDQALFFLSGPMEMVKAIQRSLHKQGIPMNRIRHEFFLGL